MSEVVHLQKTISDDIILNPAAGNELWSRKESVRNRHINCFNDAIEKLNHKLSQNNTKYRYEAGKIVRIDGGSELGEEDNYVQEPEDNHTKEHHQDQSRSEFWNRKSHTIAVLVLFVSILLFLFGDGILIRPLGLLWNYLQTIINY